MKSNTRKVWVNPVQRISVQGRHKQPYQTYDSNGMVISTVTMKKIKEYDTGSIYSFPYNSNNGRIYTGLNVIIPNPFKDAKVDHILELYPVHVDYIDQLEDIVKKERISKQQYLEIKHGVEPNYYNADIQFNMFNPGYKPEDIDSKSGYLAKFRMVLYPRRNVFTTDTPRQELCIAMIDALRDAGKIAPSEDMANPSDHEFYVSEDNEVEARFAKKREIIEGAVAKLYNLKTKGTNFDCYKFAVILKDNADNTLVRGDVSPETVKGNLSEYLSERNRHQMTHVDRFVNLYDLNSTPEGADKVHIMYLVQQAMNVNIINYRDNQYTWPAMSETPDMYNLGNSYDKVVAFFLQEMNTPEPKGKKIVVNYYKELLRQVKAKNIPFE